MPTHITNFFDRDNNNITAAIICDTNITNRKSPNQKPTASQSLSLKAISAELFDSLTVPSPAVRCGAVSDVNEGCVAASSVELSTGALSGVVMALLLSPVKV